MRALAVPTDSRISRADSTALDHIEIPMERPLEARRLTLIGPLVQVRNLADTVPFAIAREHLLPPMLYFATNGGSDG